MLTNYGMNLGFQCGSQNLHGLGVALMTQTMKYMQNNSKTITGNQLQQSMFV